MAANGIDTIQISNYVKVLVGLTPIPTTTLEEVQSVGEITDEATVVDIPSYGSQYLKKVVGSKNAGPVEIVVNLNPDSITAPQQKLLRDAYKNDTKIYFTIQMLNSAGDAGDEITFEGFVASASISNEFDAVRTQTFSVAIDGAVSPISAIDFI